MPKYRTATTVVYTVEAEHEASTVGDAIAAAYEWAKDTHHLETPEYQVNVSGRTYDNGEVTRDRSRDRCRCPESCAVPGPGCMPRRR